MQRIPSLALVALVLGWATFVVVHRWVPLPREIRPPMAVDLRTAVAAFDDLHYRTARREFVKLAQTGNAQGEMWLAYTDENGFGTRRDIPTALAGFTKAADAGDPIAARRLGQLYLRGHVVLQNVELARQWLERAAAEGDTTAERELGEIYAQGLGVSKDPTKAYAWLDIAASHGDKFAARERDRLLPVLSPDAISRAQNIAQITAQTIAVPGGTPTDLAAAKPLPTAKGVTGLPKSPAA